MTLAVPPQIAPMAADYWRASPARARFVLLVAGAGVLDGIGIFLLAPILAWSSGAGGRAGDIARRMLAGAGADTPQARLWLLLGGFAALMAMRIVLTGARDAALAAREAGFVATARHRIVAALAGAGWRRVAGTPREAIGQALGADLPRLAAAAAMRSQTGVAIAIIVPHGLLVLWLSPRLALVALAGGAVALLGVRHLLAHATAAGDALLVADDALSRDTGRFLANLKLAFAQDAADDFVAAQDRAHARVAAVQHGFLARQRRQRIVGQTAGALLGVLLIAAGAGWLRMEPALLIAAMVAVARIVAPLQQLTLALQTLSFVLPAHARNRRSARELATPAALARAVDFPEGAVLSVAGLAYAHPGQAGGLSGVTLTLAPGEAVALSGPSGTGKTTLIDLLLGLLPPDAGRITWGGVALERANGPAWRRRIAYLPQEGFAIDAPVAEALAWGQPTPPTPDGVAAALALVGAGAGVADRRLRDLSGGERQRISIARALLRRPRLLILDEATAALDADAEARLIGAVRHRYPELSLLIVTHRAATLALADRVVPLGGGVR